MFRNIIFPALMMVLSAPPAHGAAVHIQNPAGETAMAPGVTATPDGSTVILTWIERQDDQHILKFSRFANGQFGEAREIARGSNWFANWADTPGVHVRGDGTWIAHWLEKSASATYAYDVRIALSSDAGENWTAPQSPHNDGTPTEHGFVSYFQLDERRTGIVWLDGRETVAAGNGDHSHAGLMTLRSVLIDATGTLESEQRLDDSVCDCCQTAAGTTALGPVVAYRNRTDDEFRDIALVRRTNAGWTEPQLVHRDGWQIAGCPVNGPSLIARGMQVVVAWFTMVDDSPKVRFAISTDAGASFGPPVTRSPGTALGRVQLAWIDNAFALSWMEDDKDGARLRIARYSLDGKLLDDLALSRVARGRVSGFPRMVVIEDRLLLAWTAAPAEPGRGTRVLTATAALRDPEKSP